MVIKLASPVLEETRPAFGGLHTLPAYAINSGFVMWQCVDEDGNFYLIADES